MAPSEIARRAIAARGVHLAGSVPLASAEEVFRTVAGALGRHLARIPDGETGPRLGWIGWQFPSFANHPALKALPPPDTPSPPGAPPRQRVKLRAGRRAEDVQFEELGYAREAASSYGVFRRLRDEGVVPGHCRFQISLPTPLAPVWAFADHGDDLHLLLEPAWEQAMVREIEAITRAIPEQDLALQWDVAVDMILYDGIFRADSAGGRGAILDRLVRYAEYVPEGIELGYHLCYGDVGHQHFRDPESLGPCVEVANALAARLRRPLEWVMLPVPRSQSENDAYYRPLGKMSLRRETTLFVGLVHYTDGVEATRARIARVGSYVGSFGISTECGFGRRDPSTIPELLRIHAACAEPIV